MVQAAYAALPTGATLFDVNIPSFCPGTLFGVTFLYWEVNVPEYDYAVTFPPDSCGCPLKEGGDFSNLDPESRWNIRVDLGYVFPCTGNDILLSYLNYHQTDNEFTTLNPLTSIIVPTLSGNWPVTTALIINDPLLEQKIISLTTNPNQVFARASINHNAFDACFGQSINIGCKTRLRCFGGMRYANLSHTEKVHYNFTLFDATNISIQGPAETSVTVNTGTDINEIISQQSYFGGLGPHLGLTLKYHLGYGFGMIGGVSTSLLIGQATAHLDDDFNETLIARVVSSEIDVIPLGTDFIQFLKMGSHTHFPSQWRVVPNIDGKVGFDYSCQLRKGKPYQLNAELGFMISQYFNTADRSNAVAFQQPQSSIRHTLDTAFQGIYFSLQFKV